MATNQEFQQTYDDYLNTNSYKDTALKNKFGLEGSEDGLHKLSESQVKHLKGLENADAGYKANTSFSMGKSAQETSNFGWVKEGTNGFGMGLKSAMAAPRMEHGKRFLSFANPMSSASREMLGNSLGLLNKSQSIRAKKATTFFGKLAANATPLTVLGTTAYTLSSGGDIGDVADTIFPFVGMQAGWRMGKAAGGFMTKANTAKRAVGMVAGGVAGAYLGMETISGLISGARDLTSNQSSMAAFAQRMASKEASYSSQDTGASLTNRQKALQKLSKSGLNDRGQLLGNEALVLAGLY